MNDHLDNHPAPTPHVPDTGLGAAFAIFEDWLGLFFGILLVLGFGGVTFMIAQDAWVRASRLGRFGWSAAGAMWLWQDVPYLGRLTAVALRRQKPFAWHAAINTKSPVLLRPVIGIWWLGHFALGLGAAAMTRHIKPEGDAFIVHAVLFLMVTSYGYAANGFLMLGVCALTPSERIRSWAWRLRLFTDIAVACLSLGLYH